MSRPASPIGAVAVDSKGVHKSSTFLFVSIKSDRYSVLSILSNFRQVPDSTSDGSLEDISLWLLVSPRQ